MMEANNQVYDPYMISTYIPYGAMPPPYWTIPYTNMHQMWFQNPPETNKADIVHTKRVSNTCPYQKHRPKTKLYLPDGRRKISKSKLERNRLRMTTFIQKKCSALKDSTAPSNQIEEEKKVDNKDVSEITGTVSSRLNAETNESNCIFK